MTDIDQKAQAMVNEVLKERGIRGFCIFNRQTGAVEEALCRAIEQHEAFRQEVSDVVTSLCNTLLMGSDHSRVCEMLSRRFIIPKPKPDPLVEVLDKMLRRRFLDPLPDVLADEAHWLRAALDALGFEIREKNDD